MTARSGNSSDRNGGSSPGVGSNQVGLSDAELARADSAGRLSITAAASEVPFRVGLICLDRAGDSRQYTYSELAASCRNVDRAMERPRGEPVAVIARRGHDTAVTLYAALDRRIPAILLHPRATPQQRERMLAVCRDDRVADRIVAAGDGDGPAFVLFTSGSSARPKGVLLGRESFLASAAASAGRLGWHDGDRWLCCLPLAHIGGLSILTRCLIARQCAVLVDESGFDPDYIARAVARHRISLLSLVPTMLASLLDAGWQPPDFVRAVLLGGAGARRALLDRAHSRGVPVLITYGMTETCSQICTQVPGTGVRDSGHIGPPLPGIEIRVIDGRIAVRGPMLFRGYLGVDSPAERPTSLSDGWFDTGDRGWLDRDGELHVIGRSDDTIITGGENVHPSEVEAVVETFAAVEIAGVFGVPDDTWGQLIACAVVIRGDSLEVDELVRFLAKNLPSHKRPRLIGIVSEMPVGPNGKLDRRRLVAQVTERLTRLRY
ncbi:MAG: acyl--CoA ligase [Proteobacteria bacterium]|nr:acyl--CoA ligase [Pseudomonadota bacterium]